MRFMTSGIVIIFIKQMKQKVPQLEKNHHCEKKPVTLSYFLVTSNFDNVCLKSI